MTAQSSNAILEVLANEYFKDSADVFKLILMDSGFVYDRDNHDTYADVSASELATGNGYTAGGIELTGISVTRDDAEDLVKIRWNTVSIVTSGGDIGPSPGYIIFNDTDPSDTIVGYVKFGTTEQTQLEGGTAQITNPGVNLKKAA